VAYLSADYHSHATAYLAAGLFEAHDQSRFEAIAISFGPDDSSEMRQRLTRAFDRFIDVRDKSDHAVAALLREMEIDIAVDLKGFTQDARPGILAHRPAPVRVNYLGHPGTMGARYIDYLIADRRIVPEGHERHYAEKIVCLPDSYQANDRKRRIAERMPARVDEGLPDTGFVFCSFNGSFKITPEVFDIWVRLLKAADGSVLWLLDDNAAAVRNLKREAEARGVSAQRLVFAPRRPLDEHLARHRLADLFLDTLPCNAHTTASDALWAGLPLLTCAGNTFAGRVAASLLFAVGLPELITDSLPSYEALAMNLARDPAALAALKAKLVAQRNTAPLFDTERFARHLESAYVTMWERAQRRMPAESFSVAAAQP
jgi:predicted O-linked N-acetylglucosamine transferase (SPINDLY family)